MAEAFDAPPPDSAQLLEITLHYATRAGCNEATLGHLREFLAADPLTRALLALPAARLREFLVNDAYKPRMHRMYAQYMAGVSLDFALNVRRSPVSLLQIRQQDPELWAAFEAECAARLGVPPYPPPVVEALGLLFEHFQCPQVMLDRARAHGVARVEWRRVGSMHSAAAAAAAAPANGGAAAGGAAASSAATKEGDRTQDEGELVAFAHGPAEAASHVETTLTQLVQELVIQAQVRRLERERGVRLGHTHLLANALAKLAKGVERLNAEVAGEGGGSGGRPLLSLFASRRSSSRRFLLLQNRYCQLYLRGFSGTSAILPVTLATQLLKGEGRSQAYREETIPRLVGTLAHEVMMATDQLLGCRYDDLAQHAQHAKRTQHEGEDGTAGALGQAQICSLLAHLLILRSSAGTGDPLRSATALPDTFGTKGFVCAALAARVPQEFREDMREGQLGGSALLPAGVPAVEARVFDLFSVWRMDSGDYEEMASYVMGAWESRWAHLPPPARPPRPLLMHSNLDSYQNIIACSKLAPRIRPALFAFGTLADGFLPFDLSLEQAQQAQHSQQAAGGGSGGSGMVQHAGSAGQEGAQEGQPVELRLCSVVMKAVQAAHPSFDQGPGCLSAGKLGDDANLSKIQFDRRLPAEAVERTKARLLELSQDRQVDSEAASAALAAAYRAVTREGLLGAAAAAGAGGRGL